MEISFPVAYAVIIFLATYALIIADKIHRAVVALLGAVLILLARVITQERAVQAIDFNTIGLLIGMMVIVGITRRTGLFEYMAIVSAKWARGEPVRIMIALATVHIANMVWLRVLYGKQLQATPELKKNILSMNEDDEIKDHALLKKCLIVIAATIVGFVLHQYLHLESGTIGLAGATLLLLITLDDPEHALGAVEWPAIFFFIGLFIMVGALEEVGVIEYIARQSLALTHGAMVPTGLLILWLSATASAFIDNIPFVATMIPLIHDMGRLASITNLNPLWWSLSLGACLGGNGTLIGASANVVVASLAEKRGVIINFIQFTKVAFPMMLMSVTICMFYLLLRYLH